LKNNGTQGYLDPAELLADRGAKAYYMLDAGMGSDEPWSAAMSDDTKQSSKSISGDKLQLDFGKNKFRLDERKKVEPFKQKLPPIPGRVPVEETVPLDEVLNPDQDRKR
jgi:hypothetical protein